MKGFEPPAPKISLKHLRPSEKMKARMGEVVDAIPGGGITLTAVTLSVVSLTMGHLMAAAAIAGIVMSISVACLWAGAPSYIKAKLLWVCAHGGWYIDVLATVILTAAGFHLGATLGIVAMMLGLHISMMMSIARWYYSRQQVKLNGIQGEPVVEANHSSAQNVYQPVFGSQRGFATA